RPLVLAERRVAHQHEDAREADVELLGDHLRERRLHAGAELHLAAEHRDLPVRADGEPGVELLELRILRLRESDFRKAERYDERARALQEFPAVEVHAAAFRTARNMRMWVPQRHRLPS